MIRCIESPIAWHDAHKMIVYIPQIREYILYNVRGLKERPRERERNSFCCSHTIGLWCIEARIDEYNNAKLIKPSSYFIDFIVKEMRHIHTLSHRHKKAKAHNMKLACMKQRISTATLNATHYNGSILNGRRIEADQRNENNFNFSLI